MVVVGIRISATPMETGLLRAQAAVRSEPVLMARVPPRVKVEAVKACAGLRSVLALAMGRLKGRIRTGAN